MTNSLSTYPIRVAPIGPSKGMSEIVRAAEAPLITMISIGFSWSDDKAVATICTSFLNPFGNNGLNGLSVSRFVSIASVLGRPSLLKKLPGILPLAYIRSSKSIVRGKKSIPSRGVSIVAVTSVIQSPLFITTDPFACRASLPVSMLMSESPMRCLKDEVMKNQSPILWREK